MPKSFEGLPQQESARPAWTEGMRPEDIAKLENLKHTIFSAFKNDPGLLLEIAADNPDGFSSINKRVIPSDENRSVPGSLDVVEKDAWNNHLEFETLLREVQPDVLVRMAKALDLVEMIYITATRQSYGRYGQVGRDEENIRLWLSPPTQKEYPDWGTNHGNGVMESNYVIPEARYGHRKPGERIIRHLIDPGQEGAYQLEESTHVGSIDRSYMLYTLKRE